MSNRGRSGTKEAVEMEVEVLMKMEMETEMVVESLAETLDELHPPTLEQQQQPPHEQQLSQLQSGAGMMTMLCGWGLEQQC